MTFWSHLDLRLRWGGGDFSFCSKNRRNLFEETLATSFYIVSHFNLRGFISQHVSLRLIPHGFISHHRCQFYIVLHFNLRGFISQYRCQFYIVLHFNLRGFISQYRCQFYIVSHFNLRGSIWQHRCQFYVVLHWSHVDLTDSDYASTSDPPRRKDRDLRPVAR